MIKFKLSINLMLLILSSFLWFGFAQNALALELSSVGDITSEFTENLNNEIDKFVANTINDTTNNVLNSTSLSNGSNISSSQIIIANNQDVSASANGDGLILNQIESKNGECNSNTVGGPGNDTLSSKGVCNDQLTGGTGADKFICGEGTDTIRDYNPEEGDTIADTKNCEKII
jgi:hypothetical protein